MTTNPVQTTPNSNTNSFTGMLKLSVLSSSEISPIEGALVRIYTLQEPSSLLYELNTDLSGQTQTITLPSPDPSYSLAPDNPKPYSEYRIVVTANGYESVTVSGVEILGTETALLTIRLNSLSDPVRLPEIITLPDHTLYGDYPPKEPEAEIKPLEETGEIVLSRVVIPEYVIVHDGVPSDATAKNYWVRYKDYIKNVASSEIYATWPEAAIYANVLAIMSVTLNRVFTEWYRNRGYSFTITSSTAYDQKWIYGRDIFANIDYLVDTVFANYLSKPGILQPIFASYCDGQKVTCRGLSQWGSRYLASEGYSAIDIIRYYYGNDIYINTATEISGIPSSYPGRELTIGSTGAKVNQLQKQLNRIAQNYPALPKLTVDGIYGTNTASAVKTFQGIFNLPKTGITDYATWYEISDIYVGVTRISEPFK